MVENCELGRLNRYQRGLLWGGGAALSVLILIAGALAIKSSISDYIAEGRYVYLMHKASLLLDIETKQAALRRGVIQAEMLWTEHRKPPAQLIRDFAAHGGRVVIQASDKVNPQLAMGELGVGRPPAAFSDYLSFTEEQAYIASASAQQLQLELTGYFYDLDDSFISIMPPPRNGDPLRSTGAKDVTGLIKQLAPDIGNLHDPAVAKRLRESRSIAWLPAARDPFTGEEVFKLVQPAFDGDHAFIVFVSDQPVEMLRKRLHQAPYDGNFIILDGAGEAVMSEWYNAVVDPGLTQRVIDSGSWQQKLDTSEQFYTNGDFTISEPLSDTGWVLAYAYSWRTILAARWPVLLAYAGGTLAVLGALWTFLLLFDRQVFMPVFRRSQRVFESENLNRTIITAVPLGLSLLSIRSGETLLQNEIMRAYDNPAKPLYRQFLDLYWSMQKTDPAGEGSRIIERDLAVKLVGGRPAHLLLKLIEAKYQGDDVLLCSFSDITVRKQLERKLEEARAAADAASHAKSAFLATMSHEIRTPLNAILGNLELLERSQLTEAQADRLQTVGTSSRALLDIINDILDFSKVESGQMTLENTRFDVIDTVEQCLAIFAPLADAKGLGLFYKSDPALPRFYHGDAARLRQILLNLLSNAIKFTDDGKVSVSVRCQAVAGGQPELTISVSDTGIGINAAQQRSLFRAFTQADASVSRRFGGTGLGLALCKRLAELMGGRISLQSRHAAGSTFSISLPLQADAIQPDTTFAGKPDLVLLCPSAEWRTFISGQLRHWGLALQCISHPLQMKPGLPLLIFGSPREWSVADEDNLYQQASWVIDAIDDGPRNAIVKHKRSIVSCYSLAGLRQAIAFALAPPTPPAAVAGAVDNSVVATSVNSATQRQIRVLVLEDHPVNLALIRDQLNVLGYLSDLADNGNAALQLYAENRYDIVLTDLSMPGMDGYTFSTLLRRRGAQQPIIAITAHASTDERRRCERAGITDVLFKPMSLEEIAHMVGKYVPADAASVSAPATPHKPLLDVKLREALRDANSRSLETMRRALALDDMQTVLTQLHSIKGAYSMMREQDVVAVCVRMEHLGRAADPAALNSVLPELEMLLDDTEPVGGA
ncbi:MAG: ATP-binding protein [Collimonas sp.]|uniref:hybrid sensor histidine kinase/response regulator n=1 Tax=Collimonas sp. TaxID=1963772 RepID=UPI003264FF85